MTRKDFELIASVIASEATAVEPLERMRKALARKFADELWATNNKFDRPKFLLACKV